MKTKYYTDKTIIIKTIVLMTLLTTLLIATLYYIKPITANAETKEYIHNFTESGKTSDYFDITGNLTTTQGAVIYNNLTLTTALKIESSTVIKSNIQQDSILTLVFNTTFNGYIKINNESYQATNGIINIQINKGTLNIQKADSASLYYISLKPVEQETETPTEPTDPTKPEVTEASLTTIQDSLNILIAIQMIFIGSFLGYVAISRLM